MTAHTAHVVALFDNLEDAHRAVRQLRDMGIPDKDVSLVASDAHGEYGQYLTTKKGKQDTGTDGAAAGAGIGAVIGGIGGLLVGLGALTIPGIGPILAAGPLGAALAALTGAGVGAVAGGITGGLLGALVDMGLPEEEAQYYTEGVRRGGVLVTASVPDTMTTKAQNLLNQLGAVNVRQRADQWRERGWGGYDSKAEPYSADQVRQERGLYTRAGGFSEVEPQFRGHYQTTFGNSGHQYDHYRPGYEYGYQLRNDQRYRGMDWSRLEPEARRDWDTRHPGTTWDEIKGAVRHAWESVKDTVRD